MMPDNIDQNLRRGADSLPLFHCFIDQRLSFCVQLVRLFDDRLCPIEKIDQRLARRQRFLNLPKLCIAETGNVTNEVNEPVLQHSPPCCWLYRWPISRSKRTDNLRPLGIRLHQMAREGCWHIASVGAVQQHVRSRGQTGSQRLRGEPTRLTRCRHCVPQLFPY